MAILSPPLPQGERVHAVASVYNRGTRQSPNWWVKYRDENGKWCAVASGQPNKELAKTWVATIESRIANGQVGIIEKTAEQIACSTVTVRQLFEKFQAEYRSPRIKDLKEYRSQTSAVFCMRILPTLGERAASTITHLDVEKLRDDLLAAEYAGGSVAWTIARLSKVFVWGKRAKYIDVESPTSDVEYPSADVTLDYLSKTEVAGLLRYLEEHEADLTGREVPQLFAMVATAIYAGLRKGELMGLRRIDVSLDRKQITVARSYDKAPKSGKVRHVPLHPALERILRVWLDRCPVTDEGLVFPLLDVCDGWTMGQRRHMLHIEHYLRAGGCHVPARPWHSLRHTFASHFMMAGGNILTLQKLLGHASLDQTLIYAHLSPDHLATEVARMSFDLPVADVASMDEARRRKIAEDGTLGTDLVQSANAQEVSS